VNENRRTGSAPVYAFLDTWLPALFIAAAMLLIFVESMLRTLAGASIIWYVEITSVAFTWAVFLSGAAGIRSGRAIAVDALYGLLPQRTQRIMLAFSNMVTLIVALAWAWLMVGLTFQQGALKSVVLGIPTAVRTSGIVLAFALIAVYALRVVLRPPDPADTLVRSEVLEHREE
jgi:TRAP-type C4-dicarboxylate transport system permease small subunit